MKTIVYIEEKPHVRENFIRMIDGVGFFKVLSAGTAYEAIDLLEKIKVDIVIVGRQINAKEVDILDHHLRQHKNIKLLIMAERKSKVASILKAFEYKIQFETPVDVNLLLETLSQEFEINRGGQLRGISIASFLQMIELEGKTCVIKVVAEGKVGYLFCESGDLIDAQIGELNGKQAAFAILGLENALLILEYDVPDRQKTIEAPLMSLLLESGRMEDEKAPAPKENRRYKRFPCALPVTFFHDAQTHEGLISNISLSGVFLETKDPLLAGKEIQIVLYSPSLDKSCHISGVIVRKEVAGIAVEFLQASINQMAILRTVIHEVQVITQE